MCCSLSKSKMSDTRLYVGEAEKDGKKVHVLAYQNTALSSGPNAMVIPFPTTVAMNQDNVVDTSSFKKFLVDISNATKEVTKGFGRRLKSKTLDFSDDLRAEVFDVGSYTVVLATNVSQIPEALERVVESKRPFISNEYLTEYGKLYPEQPIAVCCWNGQVEAEPLLWWYEPKTPEQLFIPTLDAHDGKAPRLDVNVDTDHVISVGSTSSPHGNRVHYSGTITDNVKNLLPLFVHGTRLPRRLRNGDCFVKTASLHPTKESYLTKGSGVEIERGFNKEISYSTIMNGWH